MRRGFMISLEKRKEVFRKYFIEFEHQSGICSDLQLSRGSVTKIIKEFRERIKELGLTDEQDLQGHIDEIVIAAKRKKRNYKRLRVTDIHVNLAKDLFMTYEKDRTILGGTESILKLYDNFDDKLSSYIESVIEIDYYTKKLNEDSLDEEKKKYYQNYYMKYFNEYKNSCEELRIEYKEDVNSILRIQYISLQTFYRLINDIRNNIKREKKEAKDREVQLAEIEESKKSKLQRMLDEIEASAIRLNNQKKK